jgi:hypothetical protein
MRAHANTAQRKQNMQAGEEKRAQTCRNFVHVLGQRASQRRLTKRLIKRLRIKAEMLHRYIEI